VLTHASIVCEGMLASVNSVKNSTMQTTKPRKLCLLCSYIVNQTNTSPDSPPQQLTITGVPGAEEIEDGLAASKALNESRPRRLRRPPHLMCLVLPWTATDQMLRPIEKQKIKELPNWYHTTTTTVLRPFFRDHPIEPVPEENFWTLWCKGRLTEADTDNPAERHSRVRINHAPATPVSVWTMHWPYWPHRPYTVYMAVLYTKQLTVKLSKMLVKSMHHPYGLPQQTRIGRPTAQTSNTVERQRLQR